MIVDFPSYKPPFSIGDTANVSIFWGWGLSHWILVGYSLIKPEKLMNYWDQHGYISYNGIISHDNNYCTIIAIMVLQKIQ